MSSVDIYDPTIFVDFSFEKDNPVSLVGAPAGCKINHQLPREMTFHGGQEARGNSGRPAEHVDGVWRAVRQQDHGDVPVSGRGVAGATRQNRG